MSTESAVGGASEPMDVTLSGVAQSKSSDSKEGPGTIAQPSSSLQRQPLQQGAAKTEKSRSQSSYRVFPRGEGAQGWETSVRVSYLLLDCGITLHVDMPVSEKGGGGLRLGIREIPGPHPPNQILLYRRFY